MNEVTGSSGSTIDEILESLLYGKETPEEREAALTQHIRDYYKSSNEYIESLKAASQAKAESKNVFAALVLILIGMILGGIIAIAMMA